MEFETKDSIPNLVQRRIPIFNGESDTETAKYFIYQLQQIENSCNNNVPLLNLALDECKAKLRGNAFNLMQNSTIDSLKQFRDFIRENFLPKFTIDEVKSNFTNAKQMKNESIPNFAKRIRSLKNDYARCHEDRYGSKIADSIIDEDEKKAFVHGLKLPMARITLSAQIFQPLENLINGASAIEETERLQNQGVQCQICQEVGHTGLTCPRIKNIIHFSQPYQNNPIKCEYCSKFNHNAEQCLERKVDLHNSIKCAFCLKTGHSTSNCKTQSKVQITSENMLSNYAVPQNNYIKKYCDFHNTKGHSTNECLKMKELEPLNPRNSFNQIPYYHSYNQHIYTNPHINTHTNKNFTNNNHTNNNFTNTEPQNTQYNCKNQQYNFQQSKHNYDQQNSDEPRQICNQHNIQPSYDKIRQNINQPYIYNQSNQYNGPANLPVQQDRNQSLPINSSTDDLATTFDNMRLYHIHKADDMTPPENFNGSDE